MKRGRAHRVPLSTGALAVLDEARGLSDGGGLAFPGPGGGELGKSTVPKALARAEVGRDGARLPFELQGLGAARGGGRTAVGVRAGARRGLEDGGRLRARRPAGEAAAGHAGVVRLRLFPGIRHMTDAGARAERPGFQVCRATLRHFSVVSHMHDKLID